MADQHSKGGASEPLLRGPRDLKEVDDDEKETGGRRSYRWSSDGVDKRNRILKSFLTLAATNSTLVKHGQKGWPHKSDVKIVDGKLYWNWDEWKPSEKFIELTSVEAIVKGRRTAVLKKASKSKDKFLFSIIAPKHELNFQAESEADRDLWWAGLQIYIDNLKAKDNFWETRT